MVAAEIDEEHARRNMSIAWAFGVCYEKGSERAFKQLL